MTSSTKQPDRAAHDADPWWGGSSEPDAFTGVATMPGSDVGKPDPRVGKRAPRPRTRRRGGWFRTLLALPLILVSGVLARSPRLRRVAIRLVIFGALVLIVGGAVGVILLNNEVIARTAELGKLDTERRELRRENAVLSAEAARKSAPTRVVREAERRLGMRRSTDMPKFTYLDPASHQITAAERARRQQRLAAARAAATATTAKTAKEQQP